MRRRLWPADFLMWTQKRGLDNSFQSQSTKEGLDNLANCPGQRLRLMSLAWRRFLDRRLSRPSLNLAQNWQRDWNIAGLQEQLRLADRPMGEQHEDFLRGLCHAGFPIIAVLRAVLGRRNC